MKAWFKQLWDCLNGRHNDSMLVSPSRAFLLCEFCMRSKPCPYPDDFAVDSDGKGHVPHPFAQVRPPSANSQTETTGRQ